MAFCGVLWPTDGPRGPVQLGPVGAHQGSWRSSSEEDAARHHLHLCALQAFRYEDGALVTEGWQSTLGAEKYERPKMFWDVLDDWEMLMKFLELLLGLDCFGKEMKRNV